MPRESGNGVFKHPGLQWFSSISLAIGPTAGDRLKPVCLAVGFAVARRSGQGRTVAERASYVAKGVARAQGKDLYLPNHDDRSSNDGKASRLIKGIPT
jgi:hypothetical protein